MNSFKGPLAGLLAVTLSSSVSAQTPGPFVFGQQLSSTTLNNTFAGKLDWNNGAPNLGVPSSVDLTHATKVPLDQTVGVLGQANGGAGTVAGALKGDGAGTVSQAGCADLSDAAPSCSIDTTSAGNITAGTLPSGRLSGAYTGVTGLGTISAGVWNGSVIGSAYGGAGAVSGALKANGAGTVSQAAAADLSNGVTGSGPVVLATSPTITAPTIMGATSGAPTAGAVGEYICGWTQSTATGCQNILSAPVVLASGVTSNVSSITLSSGFYLLCGRVQFPNNTTSGSVYYDAAISDASSAMPTDVNAPVQWVNYSTAGTYVLNTGCKWLSTSSTTTQYLVAEAFFGSGGTSAAGYIWAVRLR